MTPKQQQRLSRVVWFEIPAANLDRACEFYQAVLGIQLKRDHFLSSSLAVFPYEAPAIGGSIEYREGYVAPTAGGPVVYLNADPSLDAALSRAEAAGGVIVTPRTALPGDMGAYAHVRDTEGNLVGFHAVS